jgi:MFS family permease
MFQALQVTDFRLLWVGGLVSALGSWLLVLAIPAHIFLLTGSLRATGLTVAAEYLPSVALGPVAGVVTDRWDRRRLMVAANLFCAGAVAVMLLGTSPGRYWVLYAALIAENAGIVLYTTAWLARMPAVVGTGARLSSATALNSASSGAVRLIGGPLGGILLTVGMFGSMSLVVPQTAVPRVIPNGVLGRVSAVFIAGQAAATLAGAIAGPFLAQWAGLAGLAAAASLVTFGAAVLARLTVPLSCRSDRHG